VLDQPRQAIGRIGDDRRCGVGPLRDGIVDPLLRDGFAEIDAVD
jgi:hypothetical protein